MDILYSFFWIFSINAFSPAAAGSSLIFRYKKTRVCSALIKILTMSFSLWLRTPPLALLASLSHFYSSLCFGRNGDGTFSPAAAGSSLIFRYKKTRVCSAYSYFFMAEDTGLEPAGLLHLTRFPGELLSHSVNPPNLFSCLLFFATASMSISYFFIGGNKKYHLGFFGLKWYFGFSFRSLRC